LFGVANAPQADESGPAVFIAVILIAALLGELVARFYSEPMNRWLRKRWGDGPEKLGSVEAASKTVIDENRILRLTFSYHINPFCKSLYFPSPDKRKAGIRPPASEGHIPRRLIGTLARKSARPYISGL